MNKEIKKSNSKSKKSNSSSKSLNNKENILLTKSNSKIKNKIIDVNKTINFNNETANLKLNLIPNENNFISTFQSTPSLLINNQENNNNFSLCEGCNKNNSILFCNSCKKLFCKNCDEILHLIPSYTKHSKILLSNLISINNNFCFHHKNKNLMFFCESCQEIICIECKLNGPHNDKNLHLIESLDENFNKKINKINEKIKKINEKNDEIDEKKENIENIKLNIKNKANEIYDKINNEMEESLNEIEKIEGKKKSILNFYTNNFQKKVFDIENILNSLKIKNDINNKNEIDFLLKFKKFEDSLKTILIEENFLNDENTKNILNFPSNFEENEKKIKNYDKNQILLKIKNDIIWKLLKTNYEIPELKQIEIESEKKINELKIECKKKEEKLNEFNICCIFCGEFLNLNNINEKCEFNNDEEGFINRNFTKDFPPVNLLGNFRHFFSPASGSYREFLKSGGKKEDFNPNAQKITMNKKKIVVVKKEKKKEEKKEEIKDDNYQKIVIKNKKMDQSHYVEKPLTNEWVIKIAKAIETDDINFYNLLVTFDDDNDNFISLDDVLKALKKIRVFISQKDKKSMQKYIELSKYEKNGINIRKFTANFMRPKDFEEINNKKKQKKKKNF